MVSLPYSNHGVQVDTSLARGNGETIQVATITSIQGSESFPVWAWLPGLAAAMGAFGALLGGGGLVLLVALAIASVVFFRLAGRMKTHAVTITTSSGQAKVFAETRDAAAAREIRSALETAISQRG